VNRPAQEVIVDFPPIYSEIEAVFRIHDRRDIVFSFGPVVYNPHNLVIPPELVEHEALHGHRQGTGQRVLDWWKRYMEDITFRFVEEVHAHRAEYRWLMDNGNRQTRRTACKLVAAKLASPLYGNLVSASEAQKVIKVLRYGD